MLCDSTKNLLQSIIRSLEAPGQAEWDDQVESGKQCLYEMHQMTRPSYQGYKTSGTDKWPPHIPDRGGFNRALPHIKMMMGAIRRKDRAMALASGNAALAEMNGSILSKALDGIQEPERKTTAAYQQKTPAGKPRPSVEESSKRF
jgi:hypothetical protein